MKQLRVTVQGKVYEVTVETIGEGPQSAAANQVPLSVAPASAGHAATDSAPLAGTGTGAPGEVTSPLAGKIVSVQFAPGQAVKQGEQVVVLEAMKMNTYVYATQDGTVAEILVNVGDAVAEGQVLLRIG
jgi:biotin carboxyl carrier protein